MNVFIYDIETLSNCFTATYVEKDSNETHVFVIHECRNDYPAFVKFMQQPELGLIGFNNLAFDDVVVHKMLTNISAWRRMYENGEWDRMARNIYGIAQTTIEADYSSVAPWNRKFTSRDLFTIYHYNNKAKRTSLKYVQISMGWWNVMDMPIAHTDTIQEAQIKEILEYNLNDVLSTKLMYEKSLELIDMRRKLGRKYNLPLMNMNDAKIGEMIVLRYISEQSKVEEKYLRELRTLRERINLKECILPYVSFKSKEFKDVLKTMQKTTIKGDNLKGAFNYKVYFDGMRYDFGLGGLHAVRESNIYKTTTDTTIISLDVKSFYPNLAIQNKFYPKHLGKDFCTVYEKLYNERIAAPKGSAINAGLKLAINSIYGKSNEQHSFLFDSKYTLRTTLNGQLLLTMLCEKITLTGIGKILAINTDGIELQISNTKLVELRQIVKNWEKLTNLILEEDVYSRLWYRDINNYIAEFANGNIYTKGAYEWKNRPFHKDSSMLIVPRAVQEYFINNTPITDTLRASTNIHEFCLSMRSAKGATFYMQNINTDENGNHQIQEQKLQRTNRFVVVNKGGLLIKRFEDGKVTRIRSPYQMQVLNIILEDIDSPMKDEIDINYTFYELECYKLIQGIEFKQTDLFN